MNIGKLDRYLRIEKPTLVIDPTYGSQSIAWSTHLEGWASVQDVLSSNQEATRTDLRLLTRPCKIMMRYNNTIDATMRVVLLDRDDRILQIVTEPAEFGRREAIEFIAEEYSV